MAAFFATFAKRVGVFCGPEGPEFTRAGAPRLAAFARRGIIAFLTSQQVPRLAVTFPARRLALRIRIERQTLRQRQHLHRQHIPGVARRKCAPPAHQSALPCTPPCLCRRRCRSAAPRIPAPAPFPWTSVAPATPRPRIQNEVIALAVPPGLATRKPSPLAFRRKAASESSPARFGFLRCFLRLCFSATPIRSGNAIGVFMIYPGTFAQLCSDIFL